MTIDSNLSEQLSAATPLLWQNPFYLPEADMSSLDLKLSDIEDASERLQRFAPLLAKLFPDQLEENSGIIESALIPVPSLQQEQALSGTLLVKADHSLAVAGSVKARGGIYEVLCHAEDLALEHGLLNSLDDDYRKLATDEAKAFFAGYSIAVGSTGNLGLSIGTISAAIGFKVTVHMSTEARQWKKDLLRTRGAIVVEHDTDYTAAVAAGREECLQDPKGYFIDDENSPRLYLGYAVAALRLKNQLEQAQITVDEKHPLIVYIPCGVGGAPGGVNFGLKQIFGADVQVYFAEPTQAPCVLMGIADPSTPPVYDVGLQVDTEADGLAVSTASEWVCSQIREILSGVFTVDDNTMYQDLAKIQQLEGLRIEPSAAAAIGCPARLVAAKPDTATEATHVIWTTGGRLVPEAEYQQYLRKGKALAR